MTAVNRVPCPDCGSNLIDFGDVTIVDAVRDVDSNTFRLELELICAECEGRWITLVPVDRLVKR